MGWFHPKASADLVDFLKDTSKGGLKLELERCHDPECKINPEDFAVIDTTIKFKPVFHNDDETRVDTATKPSKRKSLYELTVEAGKRKLPTFERNAYQAWRD